MSTTAKDAMPAHELTLIVAATSKMGIGKAGTLPWTGLKKEMAYFARVTKRACEGEQNTLIMGRKTWDSIPPKFRPLKGRTNIVITRDVEGFTTSQASSSSPPEGDYKAVSSISQAISSLSAQERKGGRIFVIGGAQIYEAALKMKEAKRILLTRVKGEFDCDTFFPVVLEDGGDGEWKKRGKAELDSWTGEEVPEGEQEEGGTRYVFEMWEREE